MFWGGTKLTMAEEENMLPTNTSVQKYSQLANNSLKKKSLKSSFLLKRIKREWKEGKFKIKFFVEAYKVQMKMVGNVL